MYAVSDRFTAALRESHTAVCRVDLLRQGEVIAADVPVLGGDVVDDSAAVVRRSASLTLAPDQALLDLLAASPTADGGLWPLGNELRLRAGVRYAPGDEEYATLGLFRIARPQVVSQAGDLALSITGYDRGRSVSRARFTQPYEVAAGTNYATAIRDLVVSRLPWLSEAEQQFMATPYTTPGLVFTSDDDPWKVAQDMASSIGAELYFDGDGVCVLQPQPDPAYTPPVATYHEGEDATVLSVSRDLDDEQAYNGVIVVGEGTDNAAPVRAEAWDTDPDSPTYYDPAHPADSVYGAVPMFITSQYVTTVEQAQEAANANLARVAGVVESVEFSAVNNPAHTAGDVVEIRRQVVNVDGVYILDSVKVGLGHAFTMSGTTRKRRAA